MESQLPTLAALQCQRQACDTDADQRATKPYIKAGSTEQAQLTCHRPRLAGAQGQEAS
jgi:hypothetical protein